MLVVQHGSPTDVTGGLGVCFPLVVVGLDIKVVEHLVDVTLTMHNSGNGSAVVSSICVKRRKTAARCCAAQRH